MKKPEVHLDDLAKRFASSGKKDSSADLAPVKVQGKRPIGSSTVTTGLFLLVGVVAVAIALVMW